MTTIGDTGVRERMAAGARQEEMSAEAQRQRHLAQAQMEATKRDVIRGARETGETLQQGAEDVSRRADYMAQRVADKYCDMCGQARRKYPKLMTAFIILSALLCGMGLTSLMTRMVSGPSYGYGYDSTSREMHKALDSLIHTYKQSGGRGMTGMGADVLSRLASGAGSAGSAMSGLASQFGKGGYESQPSQSLWGKLGDTLSGAWGSGRSGSWSEGYGYNEGPIMRTVHDAESKLSDLLHGGGHVMHRAGEAVRPR